MTRDEAIDYLSVLIERMDSKDKEISVYDISLEAVEMAIEALKQEPKTGHWRVDIDKSRRWDWRRFYCSECGSWQTYGETRFCPNCGVKMESEENCDACKHKDEGWDSEPCDGCCGNHSGFEPQESEEQA